MLDLHVYLISHYQIKSYDNTYCNFITWNALTAQESISQVFY